MIIDIHTHIPTHTDTVPDADAHFNEVMRPDATVRLTNSFDDYIKDMGPVDRAVAFGVAINPQGSEDDMGVMRSQSEINDTASALARAYPDKVIGFMSVHPEAPDVMDELERCVDDLGLKGMKLAPNYQNFDPLGSDARRVYEFAQLRGLPIVFHQGTAPMRAAPLMYAHPIVMDELAMNFPDLKIVMAHMGHPWHEDCITVIRKHPNVYADVSGQFYRPWQMYNGMRLAFEWSVMHKLLFASDWPLTTPQETIDALTGFNDFAWRYSLPEVPMESLEGIIHRDTLALLGLE